MWCIGTLTEEYRRRMYNLLALYARPLRHDEPVICIDEKSLQLLAHSREPLPMAPGAPLKQDYEYVRKGTTNLFVAVEPKAGQRVVSVTPQRGKVDFVIFVQALLTDTYAAARKAHLVLDNLNIHFRKCFEDVLGKRAASALLRSSAPPLHTEARELAQHGRDRDRHPQPPMPGSPHPKSKPSATRSRCLAGSSKCATSNHRVKVHSTRRRSQARSPLRSLTYVLLY